MNRLFIQGLGNNQKEYLRNRHNTGFMFIDYLLTTFDKNKIKESNLVYSQIFACPENIYLIKHKGFMNESGRATREIIKKFDIDLRNEFLLVHDDLDIKLGEFKLQFAKSPKEHNGVQSVENYLNTKDFWRLRIGVDNRGDIRIPGLEYVLENFKTEEFNKIKNVFSTISLDRLSEKTVSSTEA